MRQYSYDEVRRMSKALDTILGGAGVNERLRLYMEAGVDVADVEAHAKQVTKEGEARNKAVREYNRMVNERIALRNLFLGENTSPPYLWDGTYYLGAGRFADCS